MTCFSKILSWAVFGALAFGVNAASAQTGKEAARQKAISDLSKTYNHVKVSKDKVKESDEQNEAEAIPRPPLRFMLTDSGVAQGRAFLIESKYAHAEAVFKSVLDRAPRNTDAMAGLSAALMGLDQVEASKEWSEKTVTTDPRHIGGHYLLGLYYVSTDDIARALDRARTIKALCGNDGCPEYAALNGAINRKAP